jgi:hypothetical protein
MSRFSLALIAAVLCVASPLLAQDVPSTEEFSVTLSAGGNTIQLSSLFSHFAINTSEDLTVRFVRTRTLVDGSEGAIVRIPEGGTAVADSGPHPDISDTTLTISTAETWNVFNNTPAKKIIIHGATAGSTVTIKAKK